MLITPLKDSLGDSIHCLTLTKEFFDANSIDSKKEKLISEFLTYEDLPIQLPLQKINKIGRRFWFTSVPLSKTSENNTLLILINDLRGNVLVYDKKGTLLTESTIGSKIAINQKSQITFNEFITSTGLQIKKDPGIPIVYFSFFFLMVSIYVSFLSYSQIWELESNFDLVTGGTSNRAVLSYQEEFRRNVKTSRTMSLNSTK
mgnify:CR=1 FL=1